MGTEKRCTGRYPALNGISIFVDGKAVKGAQVSNISYGGAFISTLSDAEKEKEFREIKFVISGADCSAPEEVVKRYSLLEKRFSQTGSGFASLFFHPLSVSELSALAGVPRSHFFKTVTRRSRDRN